MVGRNGVGPQPIVYLVGADAGRTREVADVVRNIEREFCPCESLEELYERVQPDRPGCVLMDAETSDREAREVHTRLAQLESVLCLLLVGLQGGVLTGLRMLRSVDAVVLERRRETSDLRIDIEEALAASETDFRRYRHQQNLEARFRLLSPQDREVLQLIMQGQKNRTIAKRLEVSLRTVENRRRRCFDVLQAGSLAELARVVMEYEYGLLPSADLQQRWMGLPHERAEV